mmetsp:Transcript_4229/g.6525  ORF Transcript_4229/g.6525 Transcript_4229/m.6525 type:complete len:698 (-) Transcript_4229:105-2198(-)
MHRSSSERQQNQQQGRRRLSARRKYRHDGRMDSSITTNSTSMVFRLSKVKTVLLLCLGAFLMFCVTEESGKRMAKQEFFRRLGRAPGSMDIDLEIDAITPFADICPAEYPPKHAKLHDHRDHEVQYYNAHYGSFVEKINYFMDKNYEFPDIIEYTNYKYAVWNPEVSVEAKEIEWSAWDAADDLAYVQGHGMVKPRPYQENATITFLEGHFAAFHSWFPGNFGHFAHDWLPTIALMRHVLPKNTRLMLLDNPMSRKFLKFLDPDFHDFIVWIQYDQVYHVMGSLTVHLPMGIPDPMLGCCSGWDPMRQWIAEKHPERTPPEEKHVVFYSRRGNKDTKHGRVLDDANEQATLEHIRMKLRKYHKPEKIIIFTGLDETTNQTMSVEQQFNIFRDAHTFIGPHGSGLGGNYLWMDPFASSCEERTQLLEFMPGPETPGVHALYAHYYGNIRKWPMDYHSLLYTGKSTYDKTFIDLQDLDDALDDMWGATTTAVNKKKNLRAPAEIEEEEATAAAEEKPETQAEEEKVEEHAAAEPDQAATADTVIEEPKTIVPAEVRTEETHAEEAGEEHAADEPKEVAATTTEEGEPAPVEKAKPEETQAVENPAADPLLLTQLQEETVENHAADGLEETVAAAAATTEEEDAAPIEEARPEDPALTPNPDILETVAAAATTNTEGEPQREGEPTEQASQEETLILAQQ